MTRLAEMMATTDFEATYLALGLGLDPAVSPHVADLAAHRPLNGLNFPKHPESPATMRQHRRVHDPGGRT